MRRHLQPTTERRRRWLRGLPLLVGLALVALIAACGSGDSDEAADADAGATPVMAQEASFPAPANRSFRETIGRMRQGPQLAPGVSLLEPGRNRFSFALIDRGNKQIGGLEVALYVAGGLDDTARGPFMARFEPIQVDARYRSRSTAEDEDSAKSVYVADVNFPSAGSYLVSAVTRLNNRLVAASPAQVTVRRPGLVPSVGDPAIRVSTPTEQSVGGDIESIETRVPPDSMHDKDLADSLDQGRPVVLLFATPALCQTRVCGPVVDVAEEVKAEYGDRADFIHMEVYRDNDLNKGVRSQMRAWGLRTEPVAFVIGSNGKVAERIEGAFSVPELEAAVRKGLRQ